MPVDDTVESVKQDLHAAFDRMTTVQSLPN